MIDAYRRLEAAGHRRLVPPYSTDMESAIADIQLFGSAVQVSAAQKLVVDLANGRDDSFDDLLLSLREELRKELQLESIDGEFRFLRIDPPKG